MSLANVDASDVNSILNSASIQFNSLGTIQPGSVIDTNIEIK
jgi:hypothetical protein